MARALWIDLWEPSVKIFVSHVNSCREHPLQGRHETSRQTGSLTQEASIGIISYPNTCTVNVQPPSRSFPYSIILKENNKTLGTS